MKSVNFPSKPVKKRSVINSPDPVIIRCIRILVGAEVLVDSGTFQEGIEMHCSVIPPVEKAGIIALRSQQGPQTDEAVGHKRRRNKRLVHHGRDSAQNSSNPFDGPTAIGVSVFETQRTLLEIIQKGSPAFWPVCRPHITAIETF